MTATNDPTFLVKMKSGNAFIGTAQFLPGYCVLFADPAVASINDLQEQARANFLLDMVLLGDAIIEVTKPIRINYGILCNSHPFLHAHLYPRFDWEPEELRRAIHGFTPKNILLIRNINIRRKNMVR